MTALSNTDAEKAVVAALLIDNGTLAEVQDLLRPEDFTSVFWQRSYRALARLIGQGAPVDPIVLGPLVGDEDRVLEATEQLVAAMESVVSVAGVRTHALSVSTAARLRRLVAACTEVIGEAKESTLVSLDDAQKFFADATAKLTEASVFSRVQHVTAAEATKQALRLVEQRSNARGTLPGIPTGFARFDELLLGLRRKHLVIVAAKTGVGKTAIALNLAANAARSGSRVYVCSYEMGVEELAIRMLASESRVAAMRLETGEMDGANFARLARGAGSMSEMPIVFSESPPRTVPALRGECQSLKRRGGLDVLVVDYLQLMDAADIRGKNREQAVSEVSRGLKRIAMELDVCVLALSQLNRATDRHSEPKLADLRDSASIEQDANSVVMLWAESDDAPVIRFKVAKNRGAPIGEGELRFVRAMQRFESL